MPTQFTDHFTIPEKQLPNRVGLNKDELRKFRAENLREGIDFIRKKRGAVFLSEDGLSRLLKAAEHPDGGSDPESQKARESLNADVSSPPAEEEFQFWSAPTGNTRVILAVRPGDDATDPFKWVTIQVNDNKNFRRNLQAGGPMMVPATKIADGLYQINRACPRYPGRW